MMRVRLTSTRPSGQISAKMKLDREAKSSHMVKVTATDPDGADASIDVTITVTDVDEAPVIMAGGLAITSSRGAAIDYAEKGTGMVDTYGAVGPDAASAILSLEGDDAGDFRISSAGVLTFKDRPNYESPADADTDNIYMVTVKANDGRIPPRET